MSNRCNNSDNQEAIELKDSVSKPNYYCPHNFQDDYDKQDVIYTLDHSSGEKWASFNQALKREETGKGRNGKKKYSKETVNYIFQLIYKFSRD